MMRRRRRSGALQSEAVKFAKGKREVISWAFDDPSADMGSVYINSDANPSLNFDSKNNAAILAKLTGWSATSPMMTRGSDGTLKHANHNLLLRSEEFDNASWTKPNATVTADQHIAPDGTTTADLIDEGSAAAYHQLEQAYTSIASMSYRLIGHFKYIDRQYVNLAIWQSSGASLYAGVSFDILNGTVANTGAAGTGFSVTSSSITAVANGYFRCEAVLVNGSSSPANRAGFCPSDDGTVNSYGLDTFTGTNKRFYAWGLDLKTQPCHSTDYIKTTSAAVYSIPTTYDTSGNKLGFLSWEARTNAAWWSRDLTQSAWTRTNCTATKTATGTDGEANSASTLTASAANATCLQSITAVSAQRVSSCSIKRRTGTGTIEMTQDNGTTWTPITVTSEWTPVEIPAATVTNPIVGFRIVSSGDAIDVDHVQCEVPAVIGGKASPPIITAGAAVTRSQGALPVATSLFPWSATAGTVVAFARTDDLVSTSRTIFSLSDGSANERINSSVGDNLHLYAIDGGVVQAQLDAGAFVSGVTGKLALAFSANDFAVCIDGGTVSTDVSGTLPAPTALRIGTNHDSATPGNPINGTIARIKYLPERLSNADLQAETA